MQPDKQFYYKNIMITVNAITEDYVSFVWVDTNSPGRTAIPPSSKFPWDRIQPGVSYAVLTRTPLQTEYNSASRVKTWDWVSAYKIVPSEVISSEC